VDGLRDVVIVGGGPAGATTAIALANAAPDIARRVLVLEKARYPRDKPCAGALGARGEVLLRDLGVAVDVPSVCVDGISFRGRQGFVAARPGSIGRVIRRIEFDHALVVAARARGVEVREGVRVEDVRDDGERGAIVQTNVGELAARVVVGCDGVGSATRKTLGVGPGELRAQVIEVDTDPVPGDGDRAFLHFDASDPRLEGYAWDFPTVVQGRQLVCRGIYRLKTGRDGVTDGPEIGALLAERLSAMGIDPARHTNKRYAERGFDPATCLARGCRMLVGEAAGIDPATGEGIAQAIEFGAMAGAFLARELARAGAGPVAVERWQREVSRSRLARDLRIRTRLMGWFYGPARGEVDRFLVESQDALFIGCQHFAAQPYDWPKIAKVLGRGGARLLSMRIADLLARYGVSRFTARDD
jgi:flavin-dependent dehydrogenase